MDFFQILRGSIYQATLPFFLVRLLAVGLITYIPILTLGLLQ